MHLSFSLSTVCLFESCTDAIGRKEDYGGKQRKTEGEEKKEQRSDWWMGGMGLSLALARNHGSSEDGLKTSSYRPAHQCEIQTDKESKTVDKEKDKCNRVVGWGGYTNLSGTDAKGNPSNLVFNHPLSPTSTGGTRLGCSSCTYFNGCSPSLCCCSPSRDMSPVAGSRDTSLTNPALKSSPSSCRSGSFVACLPCLCRKDENFHFPGSFF